jgi:TrkA domain protein
MPKIRETTLPGVGVRHEFKTEAGDHLGTITHRGGERDLLIFDRKDPDACATVLRLQEEDSRTLTELLGGSQVEQNQDTVQQTVGVLCSTGCRLPVRGRVRIALSATRGCWSAPA